MRFFLKDRFLIFIIHSYFIVLNYILPYELNILIDIQRKNHETHKKMNASSTKTETTASNANWVLLLTRKQ